MDRRWIGALHHRKPSRLLLHHCDTVNVGRHEDNLNSMQGIGPPHQIWEKSGHIIIIIFLGEKAQHVHKARQEWWRTWVVYTLRVDTVIIILYVTNITSNIHINNATKTV